MKEKLEALMKLAKDLNDRVSEIAKEKGQKDGIPQGDVIHKAELEKQVSDMILKLHPTPKKMIFGGTGEAGAGEEKVSFGKWITMVAAKHPAIADQFTKTIMEVGTDAQGGYLVPEGFEAEILGELNQPTSIVPKCTDFPQEHPTQNLPKWLTDLTVYWVDENGTKTFSKPTFERKQSILNKIVAMVAFTDELLEDNISDLPSKIATLVAENFAVEIERIVLVGSTVAGDPFNGLGFAAGTNAVNQLGLNLSYRDVTNIWNNPNVNNKYLKAGGEWYFNKTVLGLMMNLVDLQNRPLWNIGALSAGIPPNVLGSPYNLSQQILNTYGAGGNTSIITFGDYKYVVLGSKRGGGGVQMAVTNSGTDGSSINAWMNDETLMRWVLRKGILVAIPEAYSIGRLIK